MEGIYEPVKSFPFDKMKLASPTVVSGGNYFLKMSVGNGPLYIQMPKSKTKDGIIQSGKRQYCDLLFTNENEDLIQWMEDLEKFACQYIYDHREKWFETSMELTDIENYFASPLKTYRSGKFYLVRVNTPQRLGKIHLKIFDENHQSVDPTTITDKTDVISIIEIQGIKCSARSFQIEMEIKQMMTIEAKDLFEKCLLGVKGAPLLEHSTVKSIEVTLEKERGNENPNENQNENPNENPVSSDVENIYIQTTEGNTLEDFLDEPTLEETNKQEVAPPNLDEMTELECMEIEPEILSDGEMFHIKTRNDVYYELYREARKKARIAKKMALDAYLEANKIKMVYHLECDSDSEDDHGLALEMGEGA